MKDFSQIHNNSNKCDLITDPTWFSINLELKRGQNYFAMSCFAVHIASLSRITHSLDNIASLKTKIICSQLLWSNYMSWYWKFEDPSVPLCLNVCIDIDISKHLHIILQFWFFKIQTREYYIMYLRVIKYPCHITCCCQCPFFHKINLHSPNPHVMQLPKYLGTDSESDYLWVAF